MTDSRGMTNPDLATPSAASSLGQWHIPAGVLAAYAAEDVSAADAWSAEAHLARCGRCRADLAAAVDTGALRDGLTAMRSAVLARVAGADPVGQAPGMQPAAPTRQLPAALLLRGPWVTAVVVAVFVAAVAELLSARVGGLAGSVPLVALLGPLIPLVGVGLCYRATDRGWAEAVLATPSAGLRLVLWRVLVVLVIAIPITVAVGIWSNDVRPVAWLLPSLGLTAASLALGTRIELGRAAASVAGTWIVLVVAPTAALRHLPVDVFSSVAQPIWAVALTALVTVVAVRRADFGRLPAWRPVGTGREL